MLCDARRCVDGGEAGALLRYSFRRWGALLLLASRWVVGSGHANSPGNGTFAFLKRQFWPLWTARDRHALKRLACPIISAVAALFLVAVASTNAWALAVGQRVEVANTGGAGLNVRSCAGTSCTKTGNEADGSKGTITSGPQSANGFTWWNINWDNGASGWSIQSDSSGTYLIYIPPQLTLGPTSLSFGNVQVGTCSSASYAIQLVSGTSPASGTASVSSDPPFNITAGASFSVSNGGAANVTIQFCPTSATTYSGSSTVSASGATFTNTNTVALSGTGFNPVTTGAISVSATYNGQPWSGTVNYNLGGAASIAGNTVPANFQSRPSGSYTLSYSSSGPAGATLSSITPSATQTLSAGGSISFALNFASSPTLSVMPASASVTAVAGTTSFTVSNTGGGSFSYSAAVSSDSTWLTIQSGSTGGDSGTINVTYGANSGSQRTGTIVVTASGANGNPTSVTVTQASSGSSQFGVGSLIIAGNDFCGDGCDDTINVRTAPPQSSLIFQQSGGVHGSIIGGPTTGTLNGVSYVWWQINWETEPPNQSGVNTWSAESVISLAPTTGNVGKPNFSTAFYAPANGSNILSENIFVQAGEAPTATPLAADFNPLALGNCTWYAYGRMLELGANSVTLAALHSDAANWAAEARQANILVDTTPTEGSIESLNVNTGFPQGHVAVVESVNSD